MASDMTGAFIQTTKEPPPHGGFKKILGRMLTDFGVITENQFNLVGEVQARTIVIATQADFGTQVQKEAVIAKFPERNRDGSLTGDYDLNGAMFGLNPETAVEDLDAFIATLGVENAEAKIEKALEGNSRGDGV